jgi:hypothetical protein
MVEHLRMVIHDGETRRAGLTQFAFLCFKSVIFNEIASAGKLEALMKELGGMDVTEVKPFAGFS